MTRQMTGLLCRLMVCGAALLTGCQLYRVPSPVRTVSPGCYEGPPQLSLFAGRTVLINLWASWCASCTAELRSLEALQSRFPKEQLTVITVAVDDEPLRVRAYAQQSGLKLPVFIDNDGAMRRSFGVNALPATALFNRAGGRERILDPNTGQLERVITGPRDWLAPSLLTYFAQRTMTAAP